MFNFEKVITDLESFRYINRKKKSIRPQLSSHEKANRPTRVEKVPAQITHVDSKFVSGIRPGGQGEAI